MPFNFTVERGNKSKRKVVGVFRMKFFKTAELKPHALRGNNDTKARAQSRKNSRSHREEEIEVN